MFRVIFRRNYEMTKVNEFYCDYLKDVMNVCRKLIMINVDLENENKLIEILKKICKLEETIKLFKNLKLSPSKNSFIIKMMSVNENAIPIVLENGEFEVFPKYVKLDLSSYYENLILKVFTPAWMSKIEKIFVYIYEDYNNNVLRLEICMFYKSCIKRLKHSASIDPGLKNIITLLTTENEVVYVKYDWNNVISGKIDFDDISSNFVSLIKKFGVRYLFIGDKTLKISNFMCGKFLKWEEWEKKYYHVLINKIMERCKESNIFISFIDESYSSTFKTPVNIVGLKVDEEILNDVIDKERVVDAKINNKKIKIPRDVYSCCFLLYQVGNYVPENIEKIREFVIG